MCEPILRIVSYRDSGHRLTASLRHSQISNLIYHITILLFPVPVMLLYNYNKRLGYTNVKMYTSCHQ